MSQSLIILDASGNSVDIFDTISHTNTASDAIVFERIDFLDDDLGLSDTTFYRPPGLGLLAAAAKYTNVVIVNGIGSIKKHFYRDAAIK